MAEERWCAWITQHPQPSDLVHEQRGDDVPRQDSQSPQEADEVDHVGVVLVAHVAQHAALFVVQEGAVDQSAVDQPVLKQVWKKKTGGGGVGGEDGGGREELENLLMETVILPFCSAEAQPDDF